MVPTVVVWIRVGSIVVIVITICAGKEIRGIDIGIVVEIVIAVDFEIIPDSIVIVVDIPMIEDSVEIIIQICCVINHTLRIQISWNRSPTIVIGINIIIQ